MKNELVNVQKLSEKSKMYADKSKEIFLNLKSGFDENQKISELVNSLNESFTGIREEIEAVKISHADIVKRSDYVDFRKAFSNKIAVFEGIIQKIESLKKENTELVELVESSLEISRRNQEDIGDIAMRAGERGVKRVSDYENQIVDVLGIVETLADQVHELRKKDSEFIRRGIENINSMQNKIFPVEEAEEAEEPENSEEETQEEDYDEANSEEETSENDSDEIAPQPKIKNPPENDNPKKVSQKTEKEFGRDKKENSQNFKENDLTEDFLKSKNIKSGTENIHSDSVSEKISGLKKKFSNLLNSPRIPEIRKNKVPSSVKTVKSFVPAKKFSKRQKSLIKRKQEIKRKSGKRFLRKKR